VGIRNVERVLYVSDERILVLFWETEIGTGKRRCNEKDRGYLRKQRHYMPISLYFIVLYASFCLVS